MSYRPRSAGASTPAVDPFPATLYATYRDLFSTANCSFPFRQTHPAPSAMTRGDESLLQAELTSGAGISVLLHAHLVVSVFYVILGLNISIAHVFSRNFSPSLCMLSRLLAVNDERHAEKEVLAQKNMPFIRHRQPMGSGFGNVKMSLLM